MTEAIRKSLRESPKARWTAMTVAGLAMLCGYFMADVMAPLKPMLEQHLHWTSTQYGFFTSAYGWFNVFLFMLLIGGIILDKMGVRFTGLMSTGLMVAGAVLKYFAITHTFDPKLLLQNVPIIGGMPLQVYLAGIGYAIFGVGSLKSNCSPSRSPRPPRKNERGDRNDHSIQCGSKKAREQ